MGSVAEAAYDDELADSLTEFIEDDFDEFLEYVWAVLEARGDVIDGIEYTMSDDKRRHLTDFPKRVYLGLARKVR
jgi:hypothetical protein